MNLALVFHNHQPVGQLPWAIEDVWQHGYAPFLEVLEAHPQIRVALHYTGTLLDWLEQQRPQTIETLQKLAARDQIELLGGGYYEPILAIWPESTQRAQLEKLSRRVAELFHQTPRGAWLAERVWEPQLAPVLRACGLDYTLVDSAVFTSAGIIEDAQTGAYEVESGLAESGLHVFPINQPLRYLIPWATPEAVYDYLRRFHDRHGDDALAVFADDGEKFGARPGTFQFIFEGGWLDRFFTLLEKNADWLHLATPQKYARIHAPLGKIALPAGSYAEMQAWANGDWRNFLKRYDESRDIFDEVNRVSDLLDKSPSSQSKSAAPRLEKARDHVLRAQCNDAFWHGTFGGLYLRHLRQALYSHAAHAQVLLEGNAPFARAASEANGDCIAETQRVKIGARARGGHLFMLTSKAARHNLLSTLRRHRETYLPDAICDWHARGALVDHFFGDGATPENFAAAQCPEEGDFASEDWKLACVAPSPKKVSIAFERDGHVWCNGAHAPLSIRKSVALASEASEGADDIEIEYTLTNRSDAMLDLWHACEWNVAVTGVALPDRHYHADDHAAKLRLDAIATFATVTNPILADRYLQLWLEWKFASPVALWHVPIFTASQKEGGEIERSHQSSAFVFHRKIQLAPGEAQGWSFTATMTARRAL